MSPVRRISRASFDINLIRSPINFCQAHHGQLCCSKDKEIPEYFRVIDCTTREIIKAPVSCEYVALSYVWGPCTPEHPVYIAQKGVQMLPNCPKVIEDSVKVTLQLHRRYLWVDRYCINQHDESEKSDQINQMDLIYANALVTIIAAAGDGPEHGLPGVENTLRKQQPCLKVNGLTIVSASPCPRFQLQKSKWSSRAWTFQEGILSKRRLIFTDEQAFFECNTMHCLETFVIPLDELHTTDKMRVKKERYTEKGFHLKPPGTQPGNFISYASLFSQRELKFEEDTINAMQGILHSFSNSKQTVLHFMGVEIQTLNSIDTGDELTTAEQSFVHGLTWLHKQPGKKRNYHFPSWSWAGWIGQVGSSLGYNSREYSPTDVKVWIEGPAAEVPEVGKSARFIGTTTIFRYCVHSYRSFELLFFDYQRIRHARHATRMDLEDASGGYGA